ncbi:MAG: NAD-dependent protein deacylase [Tissierellia bacterium]|nr:NAD-dependent protein deacylase [Tissierellia bacterium]
MIYDELRDIIRKYENIVFLGGAGVSTASNIPDFRSATGIYNRKNNTEHSVEYMLSKRFFDENPESFSRFYKGEVVMKDAIPNGAHHALTKLEESGKLLGIITQNIDGLHQKSGTKKVIELHGSYRDEICIDCGKHFTLEYALKQKGIVRCDYCSGIIRPNVTMYGEKLDEDIFNAAVELVAKADVLIVGGTSLVVYPAAGLIRRFNGEKLIIINKGKTKYDKKADLVFDEDIVKVLGEMVKDLEEKNG